MNPDLWQLPGATYLWQVALHSSVAGAILFTWSRHLELPSGRGRRWLLAAVLVVPLLTAAVPGRRSTTFEERVAWFDSERILALPLVGALRVGHLALGIGAATLLIAIGQELLPALHRVRQSGEALPAGLGRQARALPGWERVTVQAVTGRPFYVATSGVPGVPGRTPVLQISHDVLAALDEGELAAVLRHENAHWQRRRWLPLHLLFLARFVQLYNPVALWVFRAYCLELEIACDADAVEAAGANPRPLARALLAFYDRTDPGDLAARGTLRRRVDILLGRRPHDDRALPAPAVAAAVALLLVTLPWIV